MLSVEIDEAVNRPFWEMVRVPAVFVGRIARPPALIAERAFVPSIRSLETGKVSERKRLPGSRWSEQGSDPLW